MENDKVLQTEVSPGAQPGCEAPSSNRILVVDDEAEVRQVSAEVLMRFGYHVDTAADGAAGWEALHAKRYDLLITDNKMPKITGVELVRKLRSARMALPVVLVSGAIPTDDLNRIPSLQLAAMLLKPFTPGELLGTVRDVLRVVESTRDRATIDGPGIGTHPGSLI
jgi:DNA-binding response OmpR family regulator